jgi:hypothetical protein
MDHKPVGQVKKGGNYISLSVIVRKMAYSATDFESVCGRSMTPRELVKFLGPDV